MKQKDYPGCEEGCYERAEEEVMPSLGGSEGYP